MARTPEDRRAIITVIEGGPSLIFERVFDSWPFSLIDNGGIPVVTHFRTPQAFILVEVINNAKNNGRPAFFRFKNYYGYEQSVPIIGAQAIDGFEGDDGGDLVMLWVDGKDIELKLPDNTSL